VGEDRHPVAAIDLLHRLDDLVAGALDVVVRPDGDRFDLALGADHVFEGRAEFGRKAAMGHENDADHPRLLVRLVAAHERAAFMTIRSPSARAFPATFGIFCIAASEANEALFRRLPEARTLIPI